MGRTKCFNRNDVLDLAIQSFWKNGYASTSLSDLERATGVNKSGLYSEFDDKDDIFLESIKRFRETNPIYDDLKNNPLGWKNVESFLASTMRCSGQKGCFLANTMREYSIIPKSVKKVLEQNGSEVRESLAQNLIAAGVKSPYDVAQLIMTFSMGISLKLNAIPVDLVRDEIETFIKFLKKSSN